jgi:hypothetical protein
MFGPKHPFWVEWQSTYSGQLAICLQAFQVVISLEVAATGVTVNNCVDCASSQVSFGSIVN